MWRGRCASGTEKRMGARRACLEVSTCRACSVANRTAIISRSRSVLSMAKLTPRLTMCRWNSGEFRSSTHREASARSPAARNSRRQRSTASLNSVSDLAGVGPYATGSTGSSSSCPFHSAMYRLAGPSPADLALGPSGSRSVSSVSAEATAPWNSESEKVCCRGIATTSTVARWRDESSAPSVWERFDGKVIVRREGHVHLVRLQPFLGGFTPRSMPSSASPSTLSTGHLRCGCAPRPTWTGSSARMSVHHFHS